MALSLHICSQDPALVSTLEQFRPVLIISESELYKWLAGSRKDDDFEVLVTDVIPEAVPENWGLDLFIIRVDTREKHEVIVAYEHGADIVFDLLDEGSPNLLSMLLSSIVLPRGGHSFRTR